MNTIDARALFIYFLVGLSLLAAMVGVASICSSPENSLAEAAKYSVGLFFVVGVCAPRASFYILILMAGYLDLVKRLMIFGGQIDFFNVSVVLAAAPLTIAGICLGYCQQHVLRRRPMTRFDWLLVGVTGAIVLFVCWEVRRQGSESLLGTLQALANQASYASLLFLVPFFFPTLEECRRFLRFIIIVFLPVALYAVWQIIFGFADFESNYLQTGLSVEYRQLVEIFPRPFSTMNSAYALSVVCGALAVLSFEPWLNRKYIAATETSLWKRVLSPFLFFLILLAGSICSLTRGGWLTFFVAFVTLWFFKSKGRLLFFYIGGFLTLVTVIFSAEWLTNEADYYQTLIPTSSAFAEQAFRVSTFTARLVGFRNLITNPQFWTFFGMKEEYVTTETFRHDALTDALARYGFMPVLAVASCLIWLLWRTQRSYLALRDPVRRNLVVGCIAVAVGIYSAGLTSPVNLSVFPINIFFYLSIGITISLIHNQEEQTESDSLAAQADYADPTALNRERVLVGPRGPAALTLPA